MASTDWRLGASKTFCISALALYCICACTMYGVSEGKYSAKADKPKDLKEKDTSFKGKDLEDLLQDSYLGQETMLRASRRAAPSVTLVQIQSLRNQMEKERRQKEHRTRNQKNQEFFDRIG